MWMGRVYGLRCSIIFHRERSVHGRWSFRRLISLGRTHAGLYLSTATATVGLNNCYGFKVIEGLDLFVGREY